MQASCRPCGIEARLYARGSRDAGFLGNGTGLLGSSGRWVTVPRGTGGHVRGDFDSPQRQLPWRLRDFAKPCEGFWVNHFYTAAVAMNPPAALKIFQHAGDHLTRGTDANR